MKVFNKYVYVLNTVRIVNSLPALNELTGTAEAMAV
jgi:hypothetical protein